MLIALVLGASVTGAVVAVLGWELRTLRLKHRVDALESSYELLRNQVLGEIKRRAGRDGLDQKARNKEIEDLARTLPTEKKVEQPVWWEAIGDKNG
jgi:hypothetical protein